MYDERDLPNTVRTHVAPYMRPLTTDLERERQHAQEQAWKHQVGGYCPGTQVHIDTALTIWILRFLCLFGCIRGSARLALFTDPTAYVLKPIVTCTNLPSLGRLKMSCSFSWLWTRRKATYSMAEVNIPLK